MVIYRGREDARPAASNFGSMPSRHKKTLPHVARGIALKLPLMMPFLRTKKPPNFIFLHFLGGQKMWENMRHIKIYVDVIRWWSYFFAVKYNVSLRQKRPFTWQPRPLRYLWPFSAFKPKASSTHLNPLFLSGRIILGLTSINALWVDKNNVNKVTYFNPLSQTSRLVLWPQRQEFGEVKNQRYQQKSYGIEKLTPAILNCLLEC